MSAVVLQRLRAVTDRPGQVACLCCVIVRDLSNRTTSGRNRELETGCHILLIALVVVGCFAGIPPLFEYAIQAAAQARIAPPMRFACRSCGLVEDVREVTLGDATHNASTISGEGLTLLIALLTNKFGNQPATVMEVSVRLQDGSVRTFHEALSSASWHEGDRVKISMGRIKLLS